MLYNSSTKRESITTAPWGLGCYISLSPSLSFSLPLPPSLSLPLSLSLSLSPSLPLFFTHIHIPPVTTTIETVVSKSHAPPPLGVAVTLLLLAHAEQLPPLLAQLPGASGRTGRAACVACAGPWSPAGQRRWGGWILKREARKSCRTKRLIRLKCNIKTCHLCSYLFVQLPATCAFTYLPTCSSMPAVQLPGQISCDWWCTCRDGQDRQAPKEQSENAMHAHGRQILL